MKGILEEENIGNFKGYFKNGIYDGYGIYVWKSGKKYEGNWTKGQIQGTGKMVYPNKDYYEGEFKDGKRDGEGKLMMAGKKLSYNGPWVLGKQHGIGTIVDLSGRKKCALYSKGKLVKWIEEDEESDNFDEMSSSLA